ncbi:hypothetical protein BN946_scf184835.g5 [Trametes cinnabarina]|uniref:G-patch domain-containing protein n=1 Tax=Pycnoporus cinnabarinus TaxID=5643 RepID=A0A060SXX9_PYCCI|nr:hypothetical protein BN946_scf184835.g5 [Trametes cinnabarina]
MEEGEIPDSGHTTADQATSRAQHANNFDPSGTIYSPAFEWPGDSEPPSDITPPTGSYAHATVIGLPSSSSSSLRLVVQRSTILRRKYKLALLDGYPEIQIGRDLAPPGSETPKIRLKELEVSKLHATIFWDQASSRWSIVDMGSKHGTFIQPASPVPSAGIALGGSSMEGADPRGLRLSPPRVASMPRTLHHLDRLTIGGTTFLVHLHENGLPCTDCSPQVDEEIPLFIHRGQESDAGTSKKRKLEAAISSSTPSSSDVVQPRNPKQALALLKRSLLSTSKVPAAGSVSGSQPPQYVDRSARRRALFPDHSPATTPATERSRYPSPSVSTPTTPPVPTPISAPSAPLPSSNIGHRLLMKQGWQPGSALGDPASDIGVGLVAPLEPPTTVGRAGLGAPVRNTSSTPGSRDGDWKDFGKRRRWMEMRGNDNP